MPRAPAICARSLAALLLAAAALPARGATVTGQVAVPPSDGGWSPGAAGMTVRVAGTAVTAPVDPVAADAGAFTLNGVPAGRVALELAEAAPDAGSPPMEAFTQESKRIALDVAEPATAGAAFTLVHRWREIAGYPEAYPASTEYAAQWLSDQVGFLLFRVRSDPEVRRLFRTLDGGAHWSEIGRWTFDGAAWAAGAPFPFPLQFHFGDADHGVVLAQVSALPCAAGAGFLVTGDGGATWAFAPLPQPASPPDAYAIDIQRFAHAGAGHLLAAGTIGCHVQGYGGKFYDAVWESLDAGATWSVAVAWEVAYGGCTALGADAAGRAIAFFTPYAGGERRVARRSAAGAWSAADDARLVVNTGYGPGDAPMVDGRVWAASTGGSLADGLYRSDDGGATWTWLAGPAVGYLSFGTAQAGFGIAGNWVVATRDGGATWTVQGLGGGGCCHGPSVWAFGADRAIWQEDVWGDPNARPLQIFAYADAPAPALELLEGVLLDDRTAAAGEAGVPLLSLRVAAGPVPLRIRSLRLQASGSGDDRGDLVRLKVWWDRDGDGAAGPGDAVLGAGAFAADDGALSLTTDPLALAAGEAAHLLVTADVAAPVARGGSFAISVAAREVRAETSGGAPVAVSGAPTRELRGRTIAVAPPTPPTQQQEGKTKGGCGCGQAAGSGALAALLALAGPALRRRA